MSVDLTVTQLDTLNRLAAVLTPGGDGYPDAVEADPDGEVLQLALHHFVRDLPAIKETLDGAAGGDPAEVVVRLQRDAPAAFELLRSLLVCRYLTCRPVWDLLGYDGRRPQPAEDGEAEFHLRGDILEPVRARGPRYVPTPR